jgi:hypothetical protein
MEAAESLLITMYIEAMPDGGSEMKRPTGSDLLSDLLRVNGLEIPNDFIGFMRPWRRFSVRELFERPTISGLSDIVGLVPNNREFKS